MNIPDLSTIEIFLKKINDKPLQKITEELMETTECKHMMAYLSVSMKKFLQESSEIACDGYVSGFITCLEIFRLHQEALDMDKEDLEITVNQQNSYIAALEEENVLLKRTIEDYERNSINKCNNKMCGM